jgi:hypothetical protein
MQLLIFLGFAVLIILSLWGIRWAYIATIVLGLLYFPAAVGFHLKPSACQILFDIPLALYSLTNYKHIVLFALFFIMTRRQLRKQGWSGFGWAALATLVFGVLIEFAEGSTGNGNCRMRDLVPDSAGILLGQAIFFLWSSIHTKLKSKYRIKHLK